MQKKQKKRSNNGLRKVCGCARSKWTQCSHPWHFNFKPKGGKPYRFSLDKHFGRPVESKGEAEDLASDLRKQIRAGTFGQPTRVSDLTLRQLCDTYVERYVNVQKAATAGNFTSLINVICGTKVQRPTGDPQPFGVWPVAEIVTDSVERFREARLKKAGLGGTNRSLGRLRAVFAWAVKLGYLDATPFKRSGEAVVTLPKEPPRSRRLKQGEGEALLAACNTHLRAVVEAALETGMRRGEILGLRWRQVEGLRLSDDGKSVTWDAKPHIVLEAAGTKTKRQRRIPINTRLRAILEMRRFDPAGQPLEPETFVFGNELGQRVLDIKRAWYTTVLKAHGQRPTYAKHGKLSAEARAKLRTIDLHFHDLRREAGSRWMDAGVPLATIQRWLGHANISQTSVYLAGTADAETAAMQRYEEVQAALQRLATLDGKAGKTRPRKAKRQDEKASKPAVGRDQVMM